MQQPHSNPLVTVIYNKTPRRGCVCVFRCHNEKWPESENLGKVSRTHSQTVKQRERTKCNFLLHTCAFFASTRPSTAGVKQLTPDYQLPGVLIKLILHDLICTVRGWKRVCVCVFPVCSCAISLHFYACRLDSLSSIKVQSGRQYKFLYKYHSFTARLSLTNGFCWFSQNTRGQLQTVSLAQNILLPLLSKLRVFTISPLHGPQSKQRWLCQTHTVYHICFLTYITFYFTINRCHKSESQQQQQQQHAAETEGQQRVDPGGLRLPVFPP